MNTLGNLLLLGIGLAAGALIERYIQVGLTTSEAIVAGVVSVIALLLVGFAIVIDLARVAR